MAIVRCFHLTASLFSKRNVISKITTLNTNHIKTKPTMSPPPHDKTVDRITDNTAPPTMPVLIKYLVLIDLSFRQGRNAAAANENDETSPPIALNKRANCMPPMHPNFGSQLSSTSHCIENHRHQEMTIVTKVKIEPIIDTCIGNT
jgi:hypothetical protein